MANSAKDNKTTQDDVPKEPVSAFAEHVPLTKDKIQEIQAAASINTQANIEQNKYNDVDPQMEAA